MENKIRVGVVGLGHRGRWMFKLSADGFDFVVPAAACDIKPSNWYEKQWLMDVSMAEYFPHTEFYESYDEMLEKANLDVVIVETGADIHAEFCAKALEKNINVLTDIPVVASLEEADLLWKAEKNQKLLFQQVQTQMSRNLLFYLKIFMKKDYLAIHIIWRLNIFTGAYQRVKKVFI